MKKKKTCQSYIWSFVYPTSNVSSFLAFSSKGWAWFSTSLRYSSTNSIVGANFFFISSVELSVDSYSNLLKPLKSTCSHSQIVLVNTYNPTRRCSLINVDLGGDLGPEAGIAHRNHGLLWVTIHMHMQHEAAKGGSEVVGQAVVIHAPQEQIHR